MPNAKQFSIIKEEWITKTARLPITDDYIFKRVFAYKGNESVLKDFLEAILKKEIQKVTIKNPEIIPYEKGEKRGLLDIKAQIDDGTILDIEMQMEDEKNTEEMQQQLIPNVEIFKEIMVELIRNKEINMEALKKERSEFIQDQTADFQLNEMLLQLSEERFSDKKIGKIEVYRIEDGSTVTFENVFSENGVKKSIRCSNILIRIMRNEE